MTENYAVEQHSVGKSVVLHLLPGFLIGAVYFILLPIFHQWGYPSIMTLMSTVCLILIPTELGYLFYQGKKKNGVFSLRGIVAYCLPISVWQYLLWVPVLFVVAGVIFTVMKPVDAWLQQYIFAWVPPLESGLETGYSRSVLIITYVMVTVFGTVLGPLTEELYFRGYLLPRMGYAGKWATLLHCFLFAIYHIWSPWMFITRTLGLLPLAYAVQRRNLNLSIIVHMIVNLLDVFTAAIFISRLI
jgi:uncharacterized protein